MIAIGVAGLGDSNNGWNISCIVVYTSLPQNLGINATSVNIAAQTRFLIQAARYVKFGRTLGFALAKGLIRGLTCCPNPSLKISTYFPFLDVSWWNPHGAYLSAR
jgi:hypothetical protein